MIKESSFNKRKRRVRNGIRNAKNKHLRLTVFRSSKHIYAQIIDDVNEKTLTQASSLDKEIKSLGIKENIKNKSAQEVGKLIAERAKKKGIKKVVFDRGAYLFHGRIKTLADNARKHGLNF